MPKDTSLERGQRRSWESSRERSYRRSRENSRERSHRRSKESSPQTSRIRSPRRSKERSPRRPRERSPRRSRERSPGRSKERSPRRSRERSPRRSREAPARRSRERSPRFEKFVKKHKIRSPRNPEHRKSRESSPNHFPRSHFPYAYLKKLEENELFRQKKAREEEREERHSKKRDMRQCNICDTNGHSQFFCPVAKTMFNDFKEWRDFCQRKEICLRCVRMKGYGPKRCIGSCDPFFCRKTQALVDVTCKDCPHNDSAQGEAAGIHHRFCHCVFDKRKDTGRMKGTSRKSPERSSSSEPSSTRGLVSY